MAVVDESPHLVVETQGPVERLGRMTTPGVGLQIVHEVPRPQDQDALDLETLPPAKFAAWKVAFVGYLKQLVRFRGPGRLIARDTIQPRPLWTRSPTIDRCPTDRCRENVKLSVRSGL